MRHLPKYCNLWLPGYVQNRWREWLRIARSRPKHVWLTIADHFEPLWAGADAKTGAARVAAWRRRWPQIAFDHADSSGNPPVYTFFYPEEEYLPQLIDPLAEMTALGISDVEVHLHHDSELQQRFVDRLGKFKEVLYLRHGLLRKENGQIRFGFIHGQWALDNSLPDGRHCGLNNEITLLRDLGCYADFTMPSGPSPSQARTINTVYWATDDPERPKSYDRGCRLKPGGASGDLLMIPGPLGLRWRERLLPRIEMGEIAGYDMPTPYRVKRWLDIAPRVEEHIFLKLFAHGAQERNCIPLLARGLPELFAGIRAECDVRGLTLHYVSAWQMYQAALSIWSQAGPILAALTGNVGLPA